MVKEITVVMIIILLSIAGIFKLNEIINYQLKITDINKFIVTGNFDDAEKSISSSNLKFKDINMLKEKIRYVKETQNVK